MCTIALHRMNVQIKPYSEVNGSINSKHFVAYVKMSRIDILSKLLTFFPSNKPFTTQINLFSKNTQCSYIHQYKNPQKSILLNYLWVCSVIIVLIKAVLSLSQGPPGIVLPCSALLPAQIPKIWGASGNGVLSTYVNGVHECKTSGLTLSLRTHLICYVFPDHGCAEARFTFFLRFTFPDEPESLWGLSVHRRGLSRHVVSMACLGVSLGEKYSIPR